MLENTSKAPLSFNEQQQLRWLYDEYNSPWMQYGRRACSFTGTEKQSTFLCRHVAAQLVSTYVPKAELRAQQDPESRYRIPGSVSQKGVSEKVSMAARSQKEVSVAAMKPVLRQDNIVIQLSCKYRWRYLDCCQRSLIERVLDLSLVAAVSLCPKPANGITAHLPRSLPATGKNTYAVYLLITSDCEWISVRTGRDEGRPVAQPQLRNVVQSVSPHLYNMIPPISLLVADQRHRLPYLD